MNLTLDHGNTLHNEETKVIKQKQFVKIYNKQSSVYPHRDEWFSSAQISACAWGITEGKERKTWVRD